MPVQFPKKIYVNSDNRLSGETDDFMYFCDLDSNVPYDRVCVLSACLPKSYYNVQEGQNSFKLMEDTDEVVITIPAGNYSAVNFGRRVTDLLNSQSPNGFTYNMAYSSQLGRFQCAASNATKNPAFVFFGFNDSNIHENMGFDASSTNLFQQDSPDTYRITSKNVIKMVAENTLYIRSSAAASDNNDILQELYTARTSDMSSIVFEQHNIEANSKQLAGGSVGSATGGTNIYRIYITNEQGNRINFNGLNIQLVLLFYVDYFEKQDAYYQYEVLRKQKKTNPAVSL